MPGTGYLDPNKGERQFIQPAPVVAAESATAQSWGRLAKEGDEVTDAALRGVAVEQKQRQAGYLADVTVADRQKRVELEDKFYNDPKGFEAAWNGHVSGALGSTEAWAVPHRKTALGSEGSSALSAIQGRKRTEDKHLATQKVTALVSSIEDQAIGLAMAGAANTADFAAKLESLRGVLDTGVASGLFPPEVAEQRVAHLQGRVAAENVAAQVDKVYKGQGPAAAMKFAEDNILRNPDLRLSEEERYKYYGHATRFIRENESERKADLAVVRQDVQPISYALNQGIAVPQEQIDEAAGRLSAAGDHAGAARLRAAGVRQSTLADYGRMPLEQLTGTLGKLKGVTSGTIPLEQRISGAEWRAGGPDKNPNSSALGPGQFIGSTWLDLMKRRFPEVVAGKSTAEILALRKDRDLSLKAIKAYGEENREKLEAQGIAVDEGAISLAHFAGPAGAAAILKASPDRPVARILDRGAIEANPFLAKMTAGGLRDWATQRVEGGDLVGDQRLVVGGQRILKHRANEAWAEAKGNLDKGIMPANMPSIIQAATVVGDHGLLEEMGQRLDAFAATREIGEASPETQAAVRQALEAQNATKGLNPGQAATLRALEKLEADTREGLKNDPLGMTLSRFGDRLKAPPPIDWTNQESAVAGLKERQRLAVFAEQNYRITTIPPFTRAELDTFTAQWDRADSAGKASIVGSLAQSLDDRHLGATLQKVAKDRPSLAIAGALWKEAPDAAAGIVRGEAAIAADKGVLPKQKDIKEDIGATLHTALSGMPDVRAAFMHGIQARYADLSAQASDFTGALDSARLKRATDEVTGGLLKAGGNWLGFGKDTILAPVRGMTQTLFGSLVSGLSDMDFAGAHASNGAVVTADAWRRSGSLIDLGGGRYVATLGKADDKTPYAVLGTDGRPFVLDLKGIAQRGATSGAAGDVGLSP